MASGKKDFWASIGEKRFSPGRGVTEPPPERGWKRFFFVLGTHFWKLISLNLLFVAFCIPVFTIPAALCGMNRVLIKLYRDGNCFVWSEFYKEFRSNLFKALPFGAIGAVSLFASYYFLSLGTSLSANGIEVFTTALGILLLAFVVLFLNYVFAFLPTLALNNKQIAQNAFIFLVTEWKANFEILLCMATTVLFSVALFPYSLLLLLFFLLSIMQYMICVAINQPMQKRIIGPYEESKND